MSLMDKIILLAQQNRQYEAALTTIENALEVTT